MATNSRVGEILQYLVALSCNQLFQGGVTGWLSTVGRIMRVREGLTLSRDGTVQRVFRVLCV